MVQCAYEIPFVCMYIHVCALMSTKKSKNHLLPLAQFLKVKKLYLMSHILDKLTVSKCLQP